jgi:hypothetical protein
MCKVLELIQKMFVIYLVHFEQERLINFDYKNFGNIISLKKEVRNNLSTLISTRS